MSSSQRTSSPAPGSRRRADREVEARPKALFICGSVNQTRQLHAISRALPEVEPHFSPYYADGLVERLRRLGLCHHTILGWHWRKKAMRYLRQHGLSLDHEGRRFGAQYQLVVTCSDVLMPRNIQGKKTVLVQEGITDPERFWFYARKVLPIIPRWTAGTAWTGASNLYHRFCVASAGFRDLFIRRGALPDRLVVTGIPNFDRCEDYRQNRFHLRDFVLVCTSDARETFKPDNRRAFIRRAVRIADGRALVFKLHPNEDWSRASREIERWAPGSAIYTTGSAEEMVANCAVLVCQYSTLAFVAIALDKEVHSYWSLEELRRLLPVQGGGAAERIAGVCRELLATAPRFEVQAQAGSAAPRPHPALPLAGARAAVLGAVGPAPTPNIEEVV